MLLLVYHHLGDSWKSAREASTSRLLCFTTGFPGAPKGSPLQLFPNGSNAVHRCGVISDIGDEVTKVRWVGVWNSGVRGCIKIVVTDREHEIVLIGVRD